MSGEIAPAYKRPGLSPGINRRPAAGGMPTTMLDAALGYLANEWPVFPVCHPVGSGRCAEHRADKHSPDHVGKHPLVRWAPYQHQPPTGLEVRHWCGQWPNANIGLVTGALSGVCVVDLDGADAQAEADRRGYLPGPWATTGRVGGRHLYFAWRPDAPTIFAKQSGIDFRGQGGFVLLPPSLHQSGVRYGWKEPPFCGEPLPPLPLWVDEVATVRPHVKRDGHMQMPEVIAEHMRNDTLTRLAGSMRRVGFSAAAIEAAVLVTNSERCKPPLEEDEIRRIAASVARYAPNAADARQWITVTVG